MQISHIETIQTEVEKVDEIICNCCGESFAPKPDNRVQEILHINHRFGYESNRNGDTHDFHICEECYMKIIANFKYAPTITDLYGRVNTEDEELRYEEEYNELKPIYELIE